MSKKIARQILRAIEQSGGCVERSKLYKMVDCSTSAFSFAWKFLEREGLAVRTITLTQSGREELSKPRPIPNEVKKFRPSNRPNILNAADFESLAQRLRRTDAQHAREIEAIKAQSIAARELMTEPSDAHSE